MYGKGIIANVPKPFTWSDSKLTKESLNKIKLEILATEVFNPLDPELKERIENELGPKLLPLIKFCDERDVSRTNLLMGAPSDV